MMDVPNRRELARRALDGYDSGPDATIRATARDLGEQEVVRCGLAALRVGSPLMKRRPGARCAWC